MDTFKCEVCSKQFGDLKRLIAHSVHHRKNYYNPSVERQKNRSKLLQEEYDKNPLMCTQCNTPMDYKKAIQKRAGMARNKSSRIFCNNSCAATYNNTHKTHGTSRSKLECYLARELVKLYPTIEFHFNKKDAINSELDIYIPLLKLAFELNGIYHYEPIYGSEKLKQIQNNDKRKFQACLEKGIEFCTIDSSKLTYFKKSNALPYLKIVQDVINQKIDAEKVDLDSLPVVQYDYDVGLCFAETNKIKPCKNCGKDFTCSQTPKQIFCTRECNSNYRQKNSHVYQQVLSHKEEIKSGISKGLPLNAIAKSIGISVYAGGYFYVIKNVVEQIKKEMTVIEEIVI